MKKQILNGCMAAVLFSAVAVAQSKGATYITSDQVKAVNSLPGVDRQIVSVDIGKINEAVGVIHRGPSTPPAGGAARGAAAAAAPAGQPCGETMSTPPSDGTAGGITHDGQTETYYVLSGSGTLVTGGHIVNGRK